MTTLLNPTQPRGRRRSATAMLDELTGEDFGSLQRMVNAARKTTDHSALADLFRSAVAESGERARAETGMFLAMFRERDTEGAERFFETFKAQAGAQEAERIRQVADFQTARDRAAARAQLAQAKPPPAQTPQPKPAQPPAAQLLQKTPAYRDQTVSAPDWRRWNQALGALSGATVLEQRIYQEIFAGEGGFDVNRKTLAASGITRTVVNESIERGVLPGVKRDTLPQNLSDNQRAAVYRDYLEKRLRTVGGSTGPSGVRALDAMGHPFAASAFADALFRHGSARGSRIIQQAINDVAPGSVPEDGAMGPATYNAFRDLARDRKTCRALLDALTDQRKLRSDPGEAARLEYFRFAGKC